MGEQLIHKVYENEMEIPLKESVLVTYMTTGMTVLCDLIIIPFLIDMCVLVEDFETKSER